jgi:hypothetical protein
MTDFPHRHFPRIKGYVVTDNPEGFETEVNLMLAEHTRRICAKAEAMLADQKWNHEAIDFWEELKAKL